MLIRQSRAMGAPIAPPSLGPQGIYKYDGTLDIEVPWRFQYFGDIPNFTAIEANKQYIADRDMVLDLGIQIMTYELAGTTLDLELHAYVDNVYQQILPTFTHTWAADGVELFHVDVAGLFIRQDGRLKFRTKASAQGPMGDTRPFQMFVKQWF